MRYADDSGRVYRSMWMNSKYYYDLHKRGALPADVLPIIDDHMPDGMYDKPTDETIKWMVRHYEGAAARHWLRQRKAIAA